MCSIVILILTHKCLGRKQMLTHVSCLVVNIEDSWFFGHGFESRHHQNEVRKNVLMQNSSPNVIQIDQAEN